MTIDSQRQKVYNWESRMSKHHNLQPNEMTKKECQKFACEIWNKYKNKFTHHFSKHLYYCSLIKIKKVGGYTSSMFNGLYTTGRYTKDNKQIFYRKMHLSPYGFTKSTVLHEMAHALAPRTSLHDARFVGVLVYLYAKYLNYDFKYMVETLNEKNINFDFNFSKSLNRKIKLIQTKSLALPITGRYLVLPSALKA